MAGRKYAEGTATSVDKSVTDVTTLLRKHECDLIMPILSDDIVGAQFRFQGRLYRVTMIVPPRESFDIEMWRVNWKKLAEDKRARERQRLWRVCLIKLKLLFEEVTESGQSAARAFFPYTMLPDGQTIMEAAEPLIDEAYASGRVIGLDEVILGRKLLTASESS